MRCQYSGRSDKRAPLANEERWIVTLDIYSLQPHFVIPDFVTTPCCAASNVIHSKSDESPLQSSEVGASVDNRRSVCH